MFYGCECTFGGRSCREFGLMVYDFGSNRQEDVSFTSGGRALTDHVPGRYDQYLYGIDQSDGLSFTLVLCADEDTAYAAEFLDRYDVAEIAAWLTGHSSWQWLTIFQPDMEIFRYRCIISDVKLLTHGSVPWAFSCSVTCDSPYAYRRTERFHFAASADGEEVIVKNNGTHAGGYYPKIRLVMRGTDAKIINRSDNDRTLSLEGLPSSVSEIEIDNDHQILTDKSTGLNLYPYFNFTFLRLVRGTNQLSLIGDFDMDIICEVPENIGG